MKLSNLFLFAAFVFSALAIAGTPGDRGAKPSSPPGEKQTHCKAIDDERTITVKDSNPGCQVIYGKFGKDSIIATAQNDLEVCDSVSGKLVHKLEEAGFSCE